MRDRTAKLLGPDRARSSTTASRPTADIAPTSSTRPVAEWFNRQLHFPNWTEADRAHPETHICEWAEKNHVFVDKAYATELREGGTRAVGAAFPAVPHAGMNALPLDRWRRDRNLYIYETWVKNAQGLIH